MEGLDVYSFISCNIIIILEGTTAYLSRVIGLWELWSKFLFRISFKSLHYGQFYSFYAYSFIIILHLTIVLNTFGYKFYIFKLQHTKAFLALHNILIAISVPWQFTPSILLTFTVKRKVTEVWLLFSLIILSDSSF